VSAPAPAPGGNQITAWLNNLPTWAQAAIQLGALSLVAAVIWLGHNDLVKQIDTNRAESEAFRKALDAQRDHDNRQSKDLFDLVQKLNLDNMEFRRKVLSHQQEFKDSVRRIDEIWRRLLKKD